MRPMRLRALCAALALTVVACGGPSGSGTPPASGSAALPGVSAAAGDLDLLLARLESIHPEPFHGVARADFVAALDDLRARLPELGPEQAVVELMRVTALLSRNGRDGHEFTLPRLDIEPPVVPLRIWHFPEGWMITDAAPPHGDLAGTMLRAIAGQPIDEVVAAVEPLVPRDGPATVLGFTPYLLLRGVVLRGLGIIGPRDTIALTVEAGGSERTVEVDLMPIATYIDWAGDLGMASLPQRDGLRLTYDRGPFWWQELPGGVVYVRYAQVQQAPVAELAAMAERARDADVRRVVLDLRQNPGGDNHNNAALLRVFTDPAIDVDGRLTDLTDRLTFSAASNLATQLEQETQASFAGEPMGGGLNFWGDARFVDLPHWPIPMRAGISSRYWQLSTPDDPRLSIEPDVAVALTAADWLAGRDAVLEAAIAE
jgi:hypothetical protein